MLDAFTGASLPGLVSVAANDGFDYTYMPSRIIVEVAAGTTLSVRVSGYSGQTGEVVLSWGAAPVPANDNWAARLPLLVGANPGSNLGATSEPGEDLYGYGYETVYWSFTPSADGVAVIDTHGSSPDSALTVWTGESVDTLVNVAEDAGSMSEGDYYWSKVVVPIEAGTEYTVRFQGYSDGFAGDVQINLSLPARPSNDNWTDRASAVLRWSSVGARIGISGDILLATVEPNNDNFYFAPQPGTRSVWYSATPDRKIRPRATVLEGGVGATVAYGTAPYLSPVAQEYGAYYPVPVAVDPGVPLHLRVWSYETDDSRFRVRWYLEREHSTREFVGIAATGLEGPGEESFPMAFEVDLGQQMIAFFMDPMGYAVTPPPGWVEVLDDTVAVGSPTADNCRVTVFVKTRREGDGNWPGGEADPIYNFRRHVTGGVGRMMYGTITLSGVKAGSARAAASGDSDPAGLHLMDSPVPPGPGTPESPAILLLAAYGLDAPLRYRQNTGVWRTDRVTYSSGADPYFPFPDSTEPYSTSGAPIGDYQYYGIYSWLDNFTGGSLGPVVGEWGWPYQSDEGDETPYQPKGTAMLAVALTLDDADRLRHVQRDDGPRRRQTSSHQASYRRSHNTYV